MRGLFTSQSFDLDAGEVLSGCTDRTRILRIKSGNAWVTIEGSRQDYWLSGGDALRVATGRLIVVEAQSNGLQAQVSGETAAADSLLVRARKATRAWIAGKLIAGGLLRAPSSPASCPSRCSA